MATFGDEVKRLREERGLSQAELAERAGVTQGYISHVEKGIREGKVDILFAICRALGVSCQHFEQFFPGEGTPEPAPTPKKPKGRK